jgi:hypothetical protein
MLGHRGLSASNIRKTPDLTPSGSLIGTVAKSHLSVSNMTESTPAMSPMPNMTMMLAARWHVDISDGGRTKQHKR